MKKRFLALLLALSMLSASFLMGCGEKKEAADNEKTEETEENENLGIKKFEKEGITLSWWLLGGKEEYY